MAMMEKAAEPFVHVLLFECAKCSSPIPSAIRSDERSVEQIDARSMSVTCHCGWSAQLLGTEAKRHWVDHWPMAIPFAGGDEIP
jgi:hypothetical protein